MPQQEANHVRLPVHKRGLLDRAPRAESRQERVANVEEHVDQRVSVLGIKDALDHCRELTDPFGVRFRRFVGEGREK